MNSSEALEGWAARLRWLPAALTLAMFLIAIVVLHKSLQGIQFSDVKKNIQSLGTLHMLAAFILTIVSYLLLTMFDWLALKHVEFSLPWRATAPTAFSAFAIGHNVGFAALSGGAIRYRAYTGAGLDAPRIAGVIIFCSATFFLGASSLLGIVLLFESSNVLAILPLPLVLIKVVGLVLICLPLLYITWTFFPTKKITVGAWSITPPRSKIALGQLALGMIDLLIAATVMYTLMPVSMGISFLAFVGIYLLCMAAAVVSNVPGGIGVLEGSMLLLLPTIPTAELLGSLFAFRVMYYLLPLVVALFVLLVQITLERQQNLQNVAMKSSLFLIRAAPQIISIAVFLAGAALIFSGSLPGNTARMQLLNELLPDSLVQASHVLGSVAGLALLILARGLYRRLQGAFWLTLMVLAIGIAVSLLKGFDYEEAIVLAVAMLLLWAGRAQFYRPASLLDEPFSGGWWLSIFMVVGGAVWLGMFAFRHTQYNDSLWWNFAVDREAPKMLRASMATVVALSLFGLTRLLRTSPKLSQPANDADIAKAASILSLSSSADACVALTGDKRFLFHTEGDAFIMYQLSGNSVVALGDPVGNESCFPALVWSYRELCDKLDKRCVFYQASPKYLPLYIDLGLTFSKLGEEALVSLPDFTLEGKPRADLRQARNRGLRDGAVFEVVPAAQVAELLPELKVISDNWLIQKSVREKGFSIGTFDEKYLCQNDMAVVSVNGQLVAFANLWQAGDKSELSVDLMRHSELAPKGIMDYLFTELILWGQQQGFKHFSLGMAPLSGLEQHNLSTRWNKLGNLVFRFGEEFYNFEGLRNYKQKFDPIWQPRYLAAPGGSALPRVLIDATTLISGGVKGVFGR